MEIVRLSRQLRRMARVQIDQRRRFLEEELAKAWKQGLWYDVGKVARLLSCKGLGSKETSVRAPGVDPAYCVHASG